MSCIKLVLGTRLPTHYFHSRQVALESTKLDHDLPETLVSLIDHRPKISDDHNGNPELVFICRQCGKSVETVNRELLEVAAIGHATTVHMVTGGIQKLGEFLQAQVSGREWQAASQTVGFPGLYLHKTTKVS